MPPIVKIYQSGELIATAQAIEGESLYERIIASDVYLEAPCGGKGKCGKCLVQLEPGGEKVRACQTFIHGDMDVYIPDEMKMKIAGSDSKAKAVSHSGRLGVAIDIGTTTVVVHLTDLANCARLATASGVNAQRTYGADVISRIQFCIKNGHETLTRVIREQLADLMQEACGKIGAELKDIHYISIAGNTIMQHLADDLSPIEMAMIPFHPLSLFGDERPAGKDFPVADDAIVYYAPCVYAYVGGDITAGMIAANIEDIPGPCVYMDIGTNGEIVLKVGDKYYCCATAAGPAFEGAEITKGMAAIDGAISHLKWVDNKLELSVIGDAAPLGLCGSGLMDALAVLVHTGAVDSSGRLLFADKIEGPISELIGEIDGKPVFWLSRENDVYMTRNDIRKLQLAKAAIAGGIQTLLNAAGVTAKDINSFLIAGGFGSFLDQVSAATIGLFPKEFLPYAKTMGNMAGEGAAVALCSAEARERLQKLYENIEVVELSTSKYFTLQFIEQMTF
ncbi:DUF4445 domain-containing protein [Oscillospiraceae bacterium CM]|nr:DUF4445 domain-containing protein [Oscillospiraceae bacterium CM]